MKNSHYFLIQFHAVIAVIGYYCVHSVLNLIVGETSRFTSIAYDAIQVALSLYVLFVCRKYCFIEKNRSILLFYSVLMFCYSLRIVFDAIVGPYSSIIPQAFFINDILYIVLYNFGAVWALIASRKFLSIDIISKLLFWLSFITVVCVILGQIRSGTLLMYEEERMSVGRGLGTLQLGKIASIFVLSSLHCLINDKRKSLKFFYLFGILLGVWLSLASGSRGSLVGLVVALGLYWVFASRINVFMGLVAILTIVFVIYNIVPILTWLSNYFPIIGRRMLAAILENDQSSRQELRAQAIKLICDNPLFGYSYRLTPTETGYTPHNGILSVFLALGIPMGVLFIIFVYIKPLVAAVRIMPNRCSFFPSTMCVCSLTSSISGSSINDIVFGFSICLLAATYYYNSEKLIAINHKNTQSVKYNNRL